MRGGHRVRELDDLLVGQHPVAGRLQGHAPEHPVTPHLIRGSVCGELLEAGQVVAREQLVDVRRGDHHPERRRHELLGVALVRVEPDDPVAEPGEPLHRLLEDVRVAAVEAVGADHHDAAPAPARGGRGRGRTGPATSPIRVPPSQSRTASAARSSASSGRRRSSSRVIRVSRVPKQKTSTRELTCGSRCARTAPGCASSRPSSRTRRGSAPAAGAAARGARQSSCGGLAVLAHGLADGAAYVGLAAARAPARVRRERRRGGVSRIVRMIRRSAASSSGVQAPKSLRRTVRAPEATRPSLASWLLALLARAPRSRGPPARPGPRSAAAG